MRIQGCLIVYVAYRLQIVLVIVTLGIPKQAISMRLAVTIRANSKKMQK